MKTIQSIDRALDILELIAASRRGLRIVNLEESLSLPKSTIHRILHTLLERGYIEKAEDDIHYRLAPKIVGLSSHYLNNLELKTEAYPYLQLLAMDMEKAAHLAILQDNYAVYLDKVNNIMSFRLYSEIGKRASLHCTAVGKVLLSGLSDDELNQKIDQIEFIKYTDKTLLTKEDLLRQVYDARQNGFAVDNEEHELGIRCLAAPIYDYLGNIFAAISLTGLSDFSDKSRDAVINAAKDISKRFGYDV